MFPFPFQSFQLLASKAETIPVLLTFTMPPNEQLSLRLTWPRLTALFPRQALPPGWAAECGQGEGNSVDSAEPRAAGALPTRRVSGAKASVPYRSDHSGA